MHRTRPSDGKIPFLFPAHVREGSVRTAAIRRIECEMERPGSTFRRGRASVPRPSKSGPGESALSVDLSERSGGVSYDYLRTPTGERMVVESRGDEEIPTGEPVDVVLDHSAALLFDSRSGQRLR